MVCLQTLMSIDAMARWKVISSDYLLILLALITVSVSY